MPTIGSHSLLIVDGECVMCTAWARFILRFDRRKRIRLAATQSSIGAALYRQHGHNPDGTNLLIRGEEVLTPVRRGDRRAR